jgi:hypothetical protein
MGRLTMVPFQQHCPKSQHPSFMLRATYAAALIAMTLLSGCSGRHILDSAKLKSAATEMVSIAAEGELFATAAAENHLPANYVKGHPEYLHKQAEEVATKLRQSQPDAHDQDQLARLRRVATELLQALDSLPASRNDAHWEQSRAQFESVRQKVAEIRQAL